MMMNKFITSSMFLPVIVRVEGDKKKDVAREITRVKTNDEKKEETKVK